MTLREGKLLLINRLQQLELINQYEDEFIEKEGKRGVEQRIDHILDDINFLREFIKRHK